MAKVEWDYSERAAFYDKRADYSGKAIDEALARMAIAPPGPVADLGAGTAKLSRPLAQRDYDVQAVEPNDQMRKFGVSNTAGLSISWSVGTGEATGLADHSVAAALFGSSFNVVDQAKTLAECARILKARGWFCCMWNHRNLDDVVQARIEHLIRKAIPQYDYGKRREDPTRVIEASGLFATVNHVEDTFNVQMAREDVIEAWKSHATLARQAGSRFSAIIEDIEKALPSSPSFAVPYTTRVWFAQRLA